jgi:hypothetical protein
MLIFLHIRAGLKRNNKCCHNFKFLDSVVKPIGTMNVYSNNLENEMSEMFFDLPAFIYYFICTIVTFYIIFQAYLQVNN